jgi:hypothetical protein
MFLSRRITSSPQGAGLNGNGTVTLFLGVLLFFKNTILLKYEAGTPQTLLCVFACMQGPAVSLRTTCLAPPADLANQHTQLN